jgi:NAD(P)-dependent dehydrogenase (short-subunit alcohol dehydrogenase family)
MTRDGGPFPLRDSSPAPSWPAYVISVTEAIADELRHSGVTVTCFCPGATNKTQNWLGRSVHPFRSPQNGHRAFPLGQRKSRIA